MFCSEKKTENVKMFIYGLTQILHTDLRSAITNVCQKLKSSMTDIFAFKQNLTFKLFY